MADIYYGNFSVFQSLPDSWAIDQLFPVMPIHRLNEKPARLAMLSDITCDCDGKIDRFIDLHDTRGALPRARRRQGRGLRHGGVPRRRLPGDPRRPAQSVRRHERRQHPRGRRGEISYEQELDGDSVGDVLSYVEYDPQGLLARFRELAEEAVRQKRISATERREILDAYENGLRGYTYFET